MIANQRIERAEASQSAQPKSNSMRWLTLTADAERLDNL